jgi:hypothetical protein
VRATGHGDESVFDEARGGVLPDSTLWRGT